MMSSSHAWVLRITGSSFWTSRASPAPAAAELAGVGNKLPCSVHRS